MLNNTLDISKLEEGKIEFNNTYESVRELAELFIGQARSAAEKHQIILEHSLSPYIPPYVEVDKTRLTQIVLNLIGNAVKFTPAGGRVHLHAEWVSGCGRNQGNCTTCDGSFKFPGPVRRPDPLMHKSADDCLQRVEITVHIHVGAISG